MIDIFWLNRGGGFKGETVKRNMCVEQLSLVIKQINQMSSDQFLIAGALGVSNPNSKLMCKSSESSYKKVSFIYPLFSSFSSSLKTSFHLVNTR